MTKRTIVKTSLIGLILCSLLTWSYIKLREFMRVDSCLDGGGSWNYDTQTCEYSDTLLTNTSAYDGLVTNSKTLYVDTIIDFQCAIFISPSDQVIDSLKKINEEDFYTVADDNNFYRANAFAFLDSLKSKQLFFTSNTTATFITKNEKTFKINFADQIWGLFLFNGKDEPINADMTDIKTEYDKYMTK